MNKSVRWDRRAYRMIGKYVVTIFQVGGNICIYSSYRMKFETTYTGEKGFYEFERISVSKKILRCMFLALDFEVLRPLLFFLERKNMFVRVEMSEAILHVFRP